MGPVSRLLGMRQPISYDLNLPPGTVIALDEAGASFTFTWRTARGLHIVRSHIPGKWNRQKDQRASDVSEAVRTFKLAIGLEVLEKIIAQRGI
jgi:hypothetical protein